MKSKSFAENALLWFYPLIMGVSLISAMNIVNLSLSYYFFLVLILFISFHYTIRCRYSYKIRLLTILFIAYTLLSGLMNLFTNVTLGYLTNEIKIFIIPILFVFVGLTYEKKDLYRVFLLSTLFCLVVGFLLYIIRPGWYLEFLVRLWNDTWWTSFQSTESTNSIMETFRFGSFFGSSYAISYYSSFALCLILNDMMKEKKDRIISNRIIQLTIVLSCLLGGVLSFHRVAIAFHTLILGFFFFYSIKKKNPARKLFIYLLGGLFAVVACSIPFLAKTDMLGRLTERIGDMSFSKAMEGDRTNQNEAAIASWEDVMWGDGTGSKGALAMEDRIPAITDGNYTKILVENGVVGLSIFILMSIVTLLRGLKYFSKFRAEVFIVLYTLLSMMGANSLCISYHFVLIFWFAFGRIWNKKVLVYS